MDEEFKKKYRIVIPSFIVDSSTPILSIQSISYLYDWLLQIWIRILEITLNWHLLIVFIERFVIINDEIERVVRRFPPLTFPKKNPLLFS